MAGGKRERDGGREGREREIEGGREGELQTRRMEEKKRLQQKQRSYACIILCSRTTKVERKEKSG